MCQVDPLPPPLPDPPTVTQHFNICINFLIIISNHKIVLKNLLLHFWRFRGSKCLQVGWKYISIYIFIYVYFSRYVYLYICNIYIYIYFYPVLFRATRSLKSGQNTCNNCNKCANKKGAHFIKHYLCT